MNPAGKHVEVMERTGDRASGVPRRAFDERGSPCTKTATDVCHAMRTPLTAVIGFAEALLRVDNISEEKRREFARAILRNGHQLRGLVNRLDSQPRPAQGARAGASLPFEELMKSEAEFPEQSVLIVDDNPEIHTVVRARLEGEGLRFLHAQNAVTAFELARRHVPDLLCLDLHMPGTDGLALCRQLKEDPELRTIPVIVLTGSLDVATKVRAFELGASDYVTKPFDGVELRARVRSALRTKRYHDLLATKARIDALTGLWNRGYLDEQLHVAVSALERRGRHFSLVLADLDHFKTLNDTYGHAFGDTAICRAAAALSEVAREGDVVCRFGGEEFAIILSDTPAAAAAPVAERFRRAVEDIRLRKGNDCMYLTASFGLSGSDTLCFAGTPVTPESLLADTDEALYRAKGNGRNRVVAAPFQHP